MELTEASCDVFRRMELFYLSGFFIHRGIAESGVYLGHFDLDRFRYKTARRRPESTDTSKSFRYRFLVFLVEVLAEVGAATHVPRNEVLFVVVETLVLTAGRFSNPVPRVGHEPVEVRRVVRERKEEVKMWRTARLEL